MSILITPTEKSEITRIICPICSEKVKGVGLLKESRIAGLTFRCKKCGTLWEVKTNNKQNRAEIH